MREKLRITATATATAVQGRAYDVARHQQAAMPEQAARGPRLPTPAAIGTARPVSRSAARPRTLSFSLTNPATGCRQTAGKRFSRNVVADVIMQKLSPQGLSFS
ncbi:hypothetical protein OG728_37665 [Streptomyces microflavus]|uniref:hypothetical protein n=1 Tax=Streptomyces microflavus TaxID=1919 RepID=UPI002E14FFBC|nr:hypothetical protein OG728_37665 [Streptomyces microflavus]